MRRNAEEAKRRSTRGESMVVAVVLMLVFFILALAVLTGASVANAGVNARIRYRQAYYYARSTLDALDESLVAGALGEAMLNDALDSVHGANGEYEAQGLTRRIALSFGENAPAGLTFADGGATISYDVKAIRANQGAGPEGGMTGTVILTNVVLTFRADYEGQSYTVRVTYSCSASAARPNDVTEWMWTESKWRVRSMA